MESDHTQNNFDQFVSGSILFKQLRTQAKLVTISSCGGRTALWAMLSACTVSGYLNSSFHLIFHWFFV